jgi:hypothetical protein
LRFIGGQNPKRLPGRRFFAFDRNQADWPPSFKTANDRAATKLADFWLFNVIFQIMVSVCGCVQE